MDTIVKPPLNLPLRYVVALALFSLAVVVRLWALPSTYANAAYFSFIPATILAFFALGHGPGRLAAALSLLTGYVFFSAPYGVLTYKPLFIPGALVFLFSATLLDLLMTRTIRSHDRLLAALRQVSATELRYAIMVDEHAAAIARVDVLGRVTFVNKAFCHLLDKTAADLLQSCWFDFVLPADIASARLKLSQLTPSHPVSEFEHCFYLKNGALRWAHYLNRGIFDAHGVLVEIESSGHDITARKNLESRLSATREELQDLYDNAPCAYFSLDAAGRYLHLNAKALAWLACTSEAVVGKLGPADFMSADSRMLFEASFARLMTEGRLDDLAFDMVSRRGETRRVSLSSTAVYDGLGQYQHSRSVMYDITEMNRTQRRLQMLAAEQRAILDNDAIGILKLQGGRTAWKNRTVERMFGYAADELRGNTLRRLCRTEEQFAQLTAAALAVLDAGERYRAEVQLVRKDGSSLWVDLSAARVSRESQEVVWSFVDVTLQMRRHQQAQELAHRDGLTGLPNRRQFEALVPQMLAEAEATGVPLAMCFLDLDGFKAVNDGHGHAAGDALLCEMARRMTQTLRANDAVYRFGGDEFMLLLPNVRDADSCRGVLERLLLALEAPVALKALEAVGAVEAMGAQRQVVLSASVGVAFFPGDARTLEPLMHQADQAMYQAKRQPGSALCFAAPQPYAAAM